MIMKLGRIRGNMRVRVGTGVGTGQTYINLAHRRPFIGPYGKISADKPYRVCTEHHVWISQSDVTKRGGV